MDATTAGNVADALIAKEIAGQDAMWGSANERAKVDEGELMHAAVAQLYALNDKLAGDSAAFDEPPEMFPPHWDGFRDYGSNVANIVVAVAFLRNEIKRRIALGEDTTRSKRNGTYPGRNEPAQAFPDATIAESSNEARFKH